MRGVDVNDSYQTDQRSLDGNLGSMHGGASGLGDLTREQVRMMRKADQRKFAGFVMGFSLVMFLLAWVINDLTHFGDAIPLSF